MYEEHIKHVENLKKSLSNERIVIVRSIERISNSAWGNPQYAFHTNRGRFTTEEDIYKALTLDGVVITEDTPAKLYLTPKKRTVIRNWEIYDDRVCDIKAALEKKGGGEGEHVPRK